MVKFPEPNLVVKLKLPVTCPVVKFARLCVWVTANASIWTTYGKWWYNMTMGTDIV